MNFGLQNPRIWLVDQIVQDVTGLSGVVKDFSLSVVARVCTFSSQLTKKKTKKLKDLNLKFVGSNSSACCEKKILS